MITPAQTKEWGVLVAALVVDLVGLLWLRLISFSFIGNWPVTAIVVSLLIVMSVVTAIALALIQYRLARGIVIAGVFLVSSAVGRFEVSAIMGAVVLLVSLSGAARSITDEMHNRIQFGTRVVFRVGLRLLTVGFIAVMLSYFFPTIVGYINHSNELIKPSQIEPFIAPVQPLINQIVPTYQLQPGIQAPVVGQGTISTVVAAILNRYVGTATHDYPLFFAALVIFILYMSVYTFIPLIVWPALAVTALVMWLLRLTGLVTVVSESIPVERLRLS